MPLSKKGKKIMKSMKDQYGSKRGEQVFYASMNKGKIKGVEKKKNGGLGQKSGPPPKKGPSSQGIKVLKLRGGGMDMGNAANQAQSAAMGSAKSGSTSTSSPSTGGGTTHSPHSDTGYVKSSTPTKTQTQKAREFQQRQKDAAGKRALDTHVPKKVPFFIPGSSVMNMLGPKSFEVNRAYFQKNVAGKKGYKDTLDDYRRYMAGRGTGKVDAMGREISSTGGGGSTPSITVDPVAPVKKTPIPLMKVQPKTFDFEYKDGGLVRGSGKVLKGKVKKARIY